MIYREATASRPATVECGSDEPIVIDKLFGPTGAAELRITASLATYEWVIERNEDGPHNEGPKRWVEIARAPWQKDSDYDCGDPKCEDCADTRRK